MRAQAHTLEAIAAGIVVLASVVFALQVTAVTPLSASTASQHIENQQQSSAAGVLDAARENGSLDTAVRYWDETNGTLHGSSGGGYTTDAEVERTTLGRMLLDTFEARGVAFNVYFAYTTDTGTLVRERFIYRGEPSDNAATATTAVALYDDDPLYDADGMPTDTTVNGSSSYDTQIPPDSSTGLYNVVRVEVVVWRM
ncbi:DUF7288 family protein [Haloplanus aerogenes]|uniref:Uncharacterized protein n=1 Tax=Haloplanus aerogenes TaxID=660522 RepID=A0A3M0CXD5_9EURY|nr:hypothetical protein [Haloplanus aerogenes]AZH24985.1 hypothetical protein DU502_06195 [Haloplanus aerogenes]RMB13798.1 hypothetical protein ATH50_2240 [Haloplanus aerogenes]